MADSLQNHALRPAKIITIHLFYNNLCV